MSEWTHVVVGGPWHERIGLRARIVSRPPAEVTIYPFHGLARSSVVVLIEDDPLNGLGTPYERGCEDFTCVLNRRDLQEIEP